jgi:hypothetical protein
MSIHYAYGRSDYNVQNAFRVFGLYQPNFFHEKWPHTFADGWSLGGIYNWHTGFPWSPTFPVTSNGIVNGPSANLYYKGSPYSSIRPAAYTGTGLAHTSTADFETGPTPSNPNARNINSCFHGGKPLVSDTLASALWGADYMLQLAEAGYMGVNFHGGGNGLYTPIGGDTPQFKTRPVYYGMLFAERFAGSTFVEANLSTQSGDQNVTAFAATGGTGKTIKLAIFNKAAAPVAVKVSGLAGTKASIQWLKAPAIDSHDGVTLGGSQVGPSGEFSPKTEATLKIVHSTGTLQIPGYTAAYIET